VLPEDDVDAVLLEVLAEGVDKESLDIHHLVRDLPKETLFVISRNFGYG
jgi:hypothetical protein